MNKQTQKGGNNSTNIQAGTVVVEGMTYPEVREVALDVFRSNFYELAGKAHDIATQRAEEVTEKFLNKLQGENPVGFNQAQDPGFQHALFTVQKEYARTGDGELGDLLVDLLVDRSKQVQRDMIQIVLTESLSVAPKLTNGQLCALAICFLCKYTQNHGVGNHQALGVYWDANIQPFLQEMSRTNASFQHLEFAGCGSISSVGSSSLGGILGTLYQGHFLKGFVESELQDRGISAENISRFFIRCLNDNSLIQVNANSEEALTKSMEEQNVPEPEQVKIKELFNLTKMSEDEIRDKCIEIRPYMGNLFECWTTTPLARFSLTSVGIAIGHANVKRLTGEFADLAIWIN